MIVGLDHTALDLEYVARNMRSSDAREVWLTSRRRPLEALQRSAALSYDTRVLVLESVPAAVYGVYRPVLGTTAVPWLLGTDAINDHARTFLQACKQAIRDWKSTSRRLENRVVADNETSIRFLAALGFSFEDPRPNEMGASVRRFWMEGDHV